MILDHKAAGINGWVCVCSLYCEHKVSIQRAGWTKSHDKLVPFAEERLERVDDLCKLHGTRIDRTNAAITVEFVVAG